MPGHTPVCVASGKQLTCPGFRISSVHGWARTRRHFMAYTLDIAKIVTENFSEVVLHLQGAGHKHRACKGS